MSADAKNYKMKPGQIQGQHLAMRGRRKEEAVAHSATVISPEGEVKMASFVSSLY